MVIYRKYHTHNITVIRIIFRDSMIVSYIYIYIYTYIYILWLLYGYFPTICLSMTMLIFTINMAIRPSHAGGSRRACHQPGEAVSHPFWFPKSGSLVPIFWFFHEINHPAIGLPPWLYGTPRVFDSNHSNLNKCVDAGLDRCLQCSHWQ